MRGTGESDGARREAADWHARLSSRFVSNKDLVDFARWRKHEANAAAYAAVEAAAENGGAGKTAARHGVFTRRRLAGLIIVALIACTAAATLLWTAPKTYRTGTGEQLTVRLEDGSEVRLDTATTIRVRLRPRQRTVELVDGRAYFRVAHDAERPFLVRSSDVSVRDVGTAFIVHRSDDGVRIGLIEGRVDVTTTGDEATTALKAGHMLEIDTKDRVHETALSPEATAWMQNRIVFRDMPLRRAIAEVNRYLRRPIRLADETHADERISGSFVAGDAEAFATAITAILPLHADRAEDGSIVLQ